MVTQAAGEEDAARRAVNAKGKIGIGAEAKWEGLKEVWDVVVERDEKVLKKCCFLYESGFVYAINGVVLL